MPKVVLDRKVPDFTLPVTGGEGTWSLSEAAGRKLVLFFYPKDMTSGCTLEAQGFRVIRFINAQIYENVDGALEAISRVLGDGGG